MSDNNDLTALLTRLESLEATVKAQAQEIKRLSSAKTPTLSEVETGKKVSRKRLLKGLTAMLAGAGVTALVVNPPTARAATIANTDPNLAFDGTATGTFGVGVRAYASSLTGSTRGVQAESESTLGTGIYAAALATTGTNFGVYAESNSTSGRAIYADAKATAGLNYGVYGRTNSDSGRAIYGEAVAASGNTFGVYGRSDSTAGRAVYGLANANSGINFGVFGETPSTGGRAVYGYASAINGTTYGVYGESRSNQGIGVMGHAVLATGETFGVYARTDSSDGRGLYALATRTIGNTFGVLAENNSVNGKGVYAVAQATSGTTSGVTGVSNSPAGTGVVGSSIGYGGRFSGDKAPLLLTESASVSGFPVSSTHTRGELFVDNAGTLFYCTATGTPGTWVQLSNGLVAGGNISLTPNANGTTTISATGNVGVASLNSKSGALTLNAGTGITIDATNPTGFTINATPNGVTSVNGQTGAVNFSFSNVVFLTSPIRVIATTNSGGTASLLTSDGSGKPDGSLKSFQITGVTIEGQAIPAGAKGIIGSLTSVGASTAGNLRLWASEATPPTVNTLNIPLNSATNRGFNLTTAFTVGLSNAGKVSIGYSNGTNGSTCGFSIDVVAYIV
jgi:trimeric autotransporter adhesin